VPRPETFSEYDNRPPRPKGVKERRPDDDLTSETKASTVAVGHQRLVRERFSRSQGYGLGGSISWRDFWGTKGNYR